MKIKNIITITEKPRLSLIISKEALKAINDSFIDGDFIIVGDILDWTGDQSKSLEGRKIDKSAMPRMAIIDNNINMLV